MTSLGEESLNERERDAVQEVFNIGVGASASALSILLGEEVLVGVPRMDVLGVDMLPAVSVRSRVVYAIDQQFATPFGDGTALLMFPEEQCLELLFALTGEASVDAELSELEQEALKETGNIILNACIAALSNMVGRELEVQLPNFFRGPRDTLLNPSGDTYNSALVLAIRLELRERQVSGELGFILTLESVRGLARNILAQSA